MDAVEILTTFKAPALRAAVAKARQAPKSPALNLAHVLAAHYGLDWFNELEADSKRQLIQLARLVDRAVFGEPVPPQERADG